LVDDGDWVQDRCAQLARLRSSTIDCLQKVDGLKLSPQRGTAYVFPNVSALGATDQEVSQRLLTDAKVLISPGYQFGANGVGSFRLCYAREEVEWAKALDRIVEVLDRMRKENA
jgi:aspartate/methionine/tyrosine aminotransferase